MPSIQKLTKASPVGVLKPCCTTRSVHIRVLTGNRRIGRTSTGSRYSRRPNPRQRLHLESPGNCSNKPSHLSAGTTPRQIPNGVQALHAEGTTKDYVSTEKCIAFGKTVERRREAISTFHVAKGCFNYVSWTSPQNVEKFTTTYPLPNLPKVPVPQYIYYFIGVQSFKTATAPRLSCNR